MRGAWIAAAEAEGADAALAVFYSGLGPVAAQSVGNRIREQQGDDSGHKLVGLHVSASASTVPLRQSRSSVPNEVGVHMTCHAKPLLSTL